MTKTTAMLRRTFLAGVASATVAVPFALAVPALAQDTVSDVAALEHVQVDLVAPPFVHEHEQATAAAPRVVQFKMVIEEKPQVIDRQGTTLQAMTFNGSTPGPLMVVHEGDYVELTLVNSATNAMPHNIDFHAATGALGGGALTHVSPGEEVVLRWKATRPGIFVYHCAPEGMIAWHVVSGMSGAVMVLPREGLSDNDGHPITYDRVYYVGENDFYIPRDENGDFISYGSLGESYAGTIDTMKTLTPSHVVFNGAVGALTGENALTANVGETVLLVHSTAVRDTRPHLIGGHGDYVWAEGSFNNPPLRDLETWHIPGGAAGAAVYTFRQPGVYAYVNHNLIEAEQLGATAHMLVEGEWNDDLMTQVAEPRPIQ